MNILFMCVSNSTRSQIAEALAKTYFGENVKIQSAGTLPTSADPDAMNVMAEIGIDISKSRAKSFDHLSPHFIDNLDYIVILCEDVVSPILTSPRARVLHWPIPNPESVPSDPLEKMNRLRLIRDQLKAKIEALARDVKASEQEMTLATV